MAGDGLAALEGGAGCVVLIDGLFDRYPAIRHKELLALIHAGVPVIGASSMGALRAAELHRHGMLGAGRIFAAYAAGRLVGDDEVCVLHGPAEMDWAPLTLPLVNVRATLVRAVRRRELARGAAREVLRAAAEIFFKERTWPALSAAMRPRFGEAAEVVVARLRESYVDLKQQDALDCIAIAAGLWIGAPRRVSDGPQTAFTRVLARQVASGRRPQLASA
jgi:hypothetical protein